MTISPTTGAGPLRFGMKLPDVTALMGAPDKQYTDEDDNAIALYYAAKLRLTFYAEEDFRLGYIIASDAELELYGHTILGRNSDDVKQILLAHGISKWTPERYDSYENWFNEERWLILQTEFNEVVKVEIGAIINDKDEFDWKFNA